MQLTFSDLVLFTKILNTFGFSEDSERNNKWHRNVDEAIGLTITYHPSESEESQDIFFFEKRTNDNNLYSTIAPSNIEELLGAIKAMLSVV